MKRLIAFILIFYFGSNGISVFANEPDSAYIIGYSTLKNDGKNGLHFAWSLDKDKWYEIGPEYSYLKCDYGRWGGEKRMYEPFLYRDNNEIWHCLWSVNDYDGVFAHASSEDLINWKPQSYPVVIDNNNCKNIEVHKGNNGKYLITWVSTKSDDSLFYKISTTDFKTFSKTESISKDERTNSRSDIKIKGEKIVGTIHKVSWKLIDELINAQQLASYKNQLASEYFPDDPVHLENLKPVEATIHADLSDTKTISDMLIGVFFEDINYAADGGLYAELVQNRSFEYNLQDKLGTDPSWTSTKSWSLSDSSNGTLVIDTLTPIHENNKHYAVLQTKQAGLGLINEGFAGMAVKEGEKYNFSVIAKNTDGQNKELLVRLIDQNGEQLASMIIDVNSSEWQKIEAVLNAEKTEDNAQLEIVMQSAGEVALDMISLFPQNTFKGRKNGLRPDLAQTIADLNPRFVRFPGGCVVHGDGLENIYRWKNTIGPLEARKPQRNIWRYHQSYGLGFYEYFQFCEDIGAEPIPVIAAGVPCQNSSTGGAGQQGGVPMCDMDQFVQDILDLIEYCNGSPESTWGKKRAEAGHPEPFNLKYIGIGNEDLITDIFKERFEMIYRAIQEKYPDIMVIGTVGPFSEGSDYLEGWDFATKLGLEMVDEHYYRQPGWFINNQNYYDRYDRNKSKVYLGEYASHGNELYNALSEAIYMTAIERNADIVEMASYAPLLAKRDFTQWRTDLIFFTNTEIYPTPNYEIQKLFGQNSGDEYISSYIKLSDENEAVSKRIATSIVRDSETGDLIIKMVNILPVETKTNVLLDGWRQTSSKASKTVITGKPTDNEVAPTTTEITYKDKMEILLPAYSFVMVRIKS